MLNKIIKKKREKTFLKQRLFESLKYSSIPPDEGNLLLFRKDKKGEEHASP